MWRSDIKEFVKTYKRKLEFDKEKEENKKRMDSFRPHQVMTGSIRFALFYSELNTFSSSRNSSFGPYEQLLELDEEDMEYLYNKYKPRMKDELESKIRQLRSEYAES